MRAAAVQLNASDDLDRNLEQAARLLAEAAAGGAELVVLPEKWSLLGPGELIAEHAHPLESHPALEACRRWAREHDLTIVAGSVGERIAGADRVGNTSVLIDREGKLGPAYRKLHMFDVDVGGVAYRESEFERGGSELVVAAAPELDSGDGGDPWRLGLSVCYDLRFPELYRILALNGADLITAPSAFTATTGAPHWEVLVRARAIENQLFMIAANQVGPAPPHYDSWGHSMIVDPWGEILAQLSEGVGVIYAELDLGAVASARERIPALANRRPAAYRWPDQTRIDNDA